MRLLESASWNKHDTNSCVDGRELILEASLPIVVVISESL